MKSIMNQVFEGMAWGYVVFGVYLIFEFIKERFWVPRLVRRIIKSIRRRK